MKCFVVSFCSVAIKKYESQIKSFSRDKKKKENFLVHDVRGVRVEKLI